MKRKNISTLAALALVLSLLIPLALAADMPIQHTHQWQEVRRTKSTCSTQGQVTYECRCGEKKVEKLPAKGHAYSAWEVTTPPTCEEPGVKTHQCSACGRTETRAVDALGHDWDEGVVTKPAGYLEEGEILYTCKNDPAHTRTEVIPVRDTGDQSVMNLVRNVPPHWPEVTPDGSELRIVTEPTGGVIVRDSANTISIGVEVAGGTPPYTYNWVRKLIGKTLSESWKSWSYMMMDVYYPLGDKHSPTLEANAGGCSYYCVVYDSEGNHVTSTDANVYWSLGIRTQPQNANLHGKESVILTCEAMDGSGEYVYTLLRKDDPSFILENDGHAEVSEPGEYWFDIDDIVTGENIMSDVVRVYSAKPLSVEPKEKEYYIIHRDYGVDDETVEIDMKISGGVRPYTCVWTKYGESLETYTRDSSKIAVLHAAYTASDFGEYTLTVTDDAGDIVTKSVQVKPGPITIEGLSNMTVNPGESVLLQAKISGGVSPYTYEWYYTAPGETVHMTDGTLLPNRTDPSIVVYYEDRGMYKITVYDSKGDTASETVRVMGYGDGLTIVSTNLATEILDYDKGAAWSVEVADGTQPYTYTLLKEGTTKDSKETWNPYNTFTIFEPGWYALHIEDAEGRTADIDYMEVKDNALKIVDFTRDLVIKVLNYPENYLDVFVEGGIEPYTYKWEIVSRNETAINQLPEKIEYEGVSKWSRQQVMYPYTTWKCTVTDKNGAQAVAYPLNVHYQVKHSVVIIEHPKSVTMSSEFDTVTFACTAIGPDDHPLEYIWQYKSINGGGWISFNPSQKNSITLVSETKTDTKISVVSPAYRCIVRDTVTKEEVKSNEALVIWPKLKVSLEWVVEPKVTIIFTVHVEGGHGPYNVTCIKRSYHDNVVDEPIALEWTGGDNWHNVEYQTIIDAVGYHAKVIFKAVDIYGNEAKKEYEF